MVLWCFNGFVNNDIICKKTDLTLDVGNDVIDMNRTGPRTDPWGTPDVPSQMDDLEPSIL